ncbi:hypothetical protein LSM04_004720 [Trypanosoma melophagium]|uniref:uncharacterized protein n=1 Tax=Trypanosoma melophagium TaxID=715481 RepID=UPI00351A314F|nr:hypothetical protein LSM04_004720 [Trypanosoma melophagium]
MSRGRLNMFDGTGNNGNDTNIVKGQKKKSTISNHSASGGSEILRNSDNIADRVGNQENNGKEGTGTQQNDNSINIADILSIFNTIAFNLMRHRPEDAAEYILSWLRAERKRTLMEAQRELRSEQYGKCKK